MFLSRPETLQSKQMSFSSTSAFREGRGLPAFAGATVAFMVAVILWGAVVRATGSGAGCGAHWPLCNGTFFPHHPRLATVIEFTHRATTGVCSTLAFIVLAWTFISRPRGDRARIAAVVSVLLLLVEAFLGRALVLHGWVDQNTSDARAIMQCIHFTNTLLLLAAFTLTWWWLRPRNAAQAYPTTTSSGLALTALVATLVVGATGSVAALADTLFPSTTLAAGFAQDFAPHAPLLVRMRWMHPAAAFISVVCVLLLAGRLRPHPASRWLFALTGLQLALGIADLLVLAPITLQVLHLLGADLFWIALVAAAADALLPEQANLTARSAAAEPLAIS